MQGVPVAVQSKKPRSITFSFPGSTGEVSGCGVLYQSAEIFHSARISAIEKPANISKHGKARHHPTA